jgi:phytoene dehydrogenase-like protein
MKNKYDIIVIGSGLGGLSAAAELALSGKKILVLEQHFRVGGSATSFKRKDHIFEAGLHMTAMVSSKNGNNGFYTKLGLLEKLNFVPAPEFYHVIGKGYAYTFKNSVEENIQDLSIMFPNDAKAIKGFFETIFKIHDQTMKINERKPFGFFLSLIASPLLYPKVLNSMFSTIGKYLDTHFKNENLKAILLGNIGYYGDDPNEISLLFYAIAQTGYFRYGGAYIQGGSHQLPDSMADIITNNGGKIMTMQEVTNIIMKDGKAIGVKYKSKRKDASESQAFADTIIANTAVPNVRNTLLAKEDSKVLEKFDTFSIGPSIMTLYVALKKPLKELGNKYYSIALYNSEKFELKQFAQLNHGDYKDRPAILCDYSQLDSKLSPEGKGYFVLSLMDYLKDWENLSESDYKFKKKQVMDTLIDRICELFPKMRDQIEHVELATARTMKHYLMTPNGTAYGYNNTPKQSLIFRPRAKSGIPNLYFASAWALPGAGFGGALTSGNICAAQIKKDLGISSNEI